MDSSRSRLTVRLAAAAALLAALPSCARHGSLPSGERMLVEEKFLAPGEARTFRVRYVARVTGVPAGAARLRLWWPVPSSSNLQRIEDLKFSGPLPPALGNEPRYGNRIAYVELADPPAEVELEMVFTCTRREARVSLEGLEEEGRDPPEAFRVFREPDRLVVIDDRVERLAEEATRGRTGTLARARGIYELVMARMEYDKSGTGWGRGDTIHACEAGKGNCTDFHALFNSLCRAAGIASGFEIGLYLPYEARKTKGWQPEPGGYHCWAAFRVPGRTWVPVDISEADRFPERSEFFFGGHTANRVTLSVGRDLVLAPPQDGEPLNYLLDPYAEVDGNAHQEVEKVWFFQDL